MSQKLSDLRVPLEEVFGPLLSSLFASVEGPSLMALWDGILQCSDPVLSIFMIVVITINAADSLSEMNSASGALELLTEALKMMEEEDVPGCGLFFFIFFPKLTLVVLSEILNNNFIQIRFNRFGYKLSRSHTSVAY